MSDVLNHASLAYPMTKMNFLVSVPELSGAMAAFTEVSGIEATVDVIEFRQGNAHSLAPVKIPGLVKHGNITLKMGYTIGNSFKDWIKDHASDALKEKAEVLCEKMGSTIQPICISLLKGTFNTLQKYLTNKFSAKEMCIAIQICN